MKRLNVLLTKSLTNSVVLSAFLTTTTAPNLANAQAQQQALTKPAQAQATTKASTQNQQNQQANKPALVPSIKAENCGDLAAAEKSLGARLSEEITKAHNAGFKPSIAYDPTKSGGPALSQKEAQNVTRALFAAIQKPETAAEEASNALTKSPNRRTSLGLRYRCPGDANPKVSIERNKAKNASVACDPRDVSMDIQHVVQSPLTVEQAKDRYLQYRLAGSTVAETKLCTKGKAGCASEASYAPFDSSRIPRQPAEGYFSQEYVSKIFFNKTERYVTKAIPVEICNSRAFLVTKFSTSGDNGFLSSTSLSLIAKVGDKTLHISDFSGQAAGGSMVSKALSFTSQTLSGTFDDSNNLVAVFQSTEKPVAGEVRGNSARAIAQQRSQNQQPARTTR
jgi:hypothetical protein